MSKLSCPTCGREMRGQPADFPAFPFCSDRCKAIDLGRWLNESYRIEAEEQDAPPEGMDPL